MKCLEKDNMWNYGKFIGNREDWLRLNINNLEPAYWNHTDLNDISKDFFREFKDKMKLNTANWKALPRVSNFIKEKFGEKFLKELTGRTL